MLIVSASPRIDIPAFFWGISLLIELKRDTIWRRDFMEYNQKIQRKAAVKQRESSSHFSVLFIMSTAYIAVGTNVQGFKAMLPMVRDDFQIGSTEADLYTTFFLFKCYFNCYI